MKSQLSIIEKKAISSQNLQNRLSINKKLGSKDLTKWLFSKYKIKKKEKINGKIQNKIINMTGCLPDQDKIIDKENPKFICPVELDDNGFFEKKK